MIQTVSSKGNMKLLSCLCVAVGLLFFSSLDVVNLMPETDYCQLKNCPVNKKLPHIACNNKGGWSLQCGKDPQIVPIPENIKNLILNHHNTYRDVVAGTGFHRLPTAGRMLKMMWDSDLAYLAKLLVKRCDLHPTEHCMSTEVFSAPSFHAVYNKFKKNEDAFRVVRSQLNSWYDQYKHVTAASLIDGLSNNKTEVGHFLRMMVGPSNRMGCAMARNEKNGWTQQWLSCLYSCSPKKNSLIYEYAVSAGKFCTTGVDGKFQHLCNESEPVQDCKSSDQFKVVITNDTASLIRAMMKNPSYSRSFICRYCSLCCKVWGWVKGGWGRLKQTWASIMGGGGGGANLNTE
uniref:Venom allergen 5-like n=1 Tax=Drosophila rhopaloa TaxID=1041015 RepID=A0A6P4EV98_DRORH